MATSNIIGIPADEKAFEEHCIPLFAAHLSDPNVKLVGTRGMKQRGLDLIGRRNRDPHQPVGIQCKLITRGAKLSEAVVREEVAKALTVVPALTEYYVVTTASDDPALDSLAIELSQEQAAAGRSIDIQIWGWDNMQERIRKYPEALRAFDPDYSASTTSLMALGVEVAEKHTILIEQTAQAAAGIETIQSMMRATLADTQRGAAFDAHLDAQVDDYRNLMNNGKPRTALTLLESLDATLTSENSPAIRARARANIGVAHLKLGHEEVAGQIISEAYAINPSDPKVRGNYVLALSLLGKTSELGKLDENF